MAMRGGFVKTTLIGRGVELAKLRTLAVVGPERRAKIVIHVTGSIHHDSPLEQH